MTDNKLKDILGWDIVNWSESIKYWEHFICQKNIDNITALELGSGFNGGLSLWLALKGIKTTCSAYHPSYRNVLDKAKTIHLKHGVNDLIDYEEIDATNIPYTSKYDIICYKSMLGGIVRKDDLKTAENVVKQIYAALKPNGMLLFAENITSTVIHKILRKQHGSGRNNWRYFTIDELNLLHTDFKSFEYLTFGFLGCFGRGEKQRSILGRIDQTLFRNIPENWNYVLAGVAIK